jgi:hypothetical protein
MARQVTISAAAGEKGKSMTEARDRLCVACGRDPGQAPLLRLEYRDGSFWICPQHLPMLIHDPGSLAGKLPGAEKLSPADHHD